MHDGGAGRLTVDLTRLWSSGDLAAPLVDLTRLGLGEFFDEGSTEV